MQEWGEELLSGWRKRLDKSPGLPDRGRLEEAIITPTILRRKAGVVELIENPVNECGFGIDKPIRQCLIDSPERGRRKRGRLGGPHQGGMSERFAVVMTHGKSVAAFHRVAHGHVPKAQGPIHDSDMG